MKFKTMKEFNLFQKGEFCGALEVGGLAIIFTATSLSLFDNILKVIGAAFICVGLLMIINKAREERSKKRK